MGRHSVPDDGDLLVEEPVAPVQAQRPRPRPRHAATEDAETDVIDPELVERALDHPPRDVVDAVVVEDESYSVRTRSRPGEPLAELAAPRPAPGPKPEPAVAKRERPGRADVRLLRQSSSLRARCIAALLLPFVLYTVVLVVVGRVDAYLFWIWIPAILGGVLFGAQLDSAHKRATTTTE